MTEYQEMYDSGPRPMHGQLPETIPGLRQSLERQLLARGVGAALALLNQRTRFRFTGLYRVAHPELHTIALYDRENPTVAMSGAVAQLDDTYCAIVHARRRPFRVADAPSDARVQAHAARESIQSYAGVPIRLAGGAVIGTLCHYDGRPRIMPSSELAVLVDVAPLFTAWLRGEGAS